MGWTIEEAVNLTGRVAKTRTSISLDVGAGLMTFPSVASACRYLGLRRGPIARARARNGVSWEDGIRSALVQQTHEAMDNANMDFDISTAGRHRKSRGTGLQPA